MKALLAALLLVLAGCASSNYTRAQESFNLGRWAESERYMLAELRNRPTADNWRTLAVIYHKQDKRPQMIQALQMAARYGDAQSQTALIELRQPVPPADLARTQGPSAAAMIANEFVRGANGNRRKSRDCIASPVGPYVVNLDCD